MGAFIFAGIIFAVTCLWCLFVAFANGMATAPGVNDSPVLPWFVGGTMVALVIASTHWLHLGW